MLTRHTVCAVLLVSCILQAIVSALPTDSNRILRSKNINRFVPKTEAALTVEGYVSDKNEFSSQSGSSGSQNVLSNQNNENEENVGETQESKVEEYQCTDSHSTNPNPVPEHTHIRKKIVRRRIKRKTNNSKKKVIKGNAQDREIEQDGDTSNLVTKSTVGMPRRGNNTSKNQVKQVMDNEEADSYEDNVLLKDKKLFGKQRKQTNVNGRSEEPDKISYNVNNETEGEEETEFSVGEENIIGPQKEMNQKNNKIKNEVKNTNTQQQIKSNGKNKLLQEKDLENDSEYVTDENEEGTEEVESTLQHLNYTNAHTHLRKRANNITETDDQNPEEEDAEETEEEKSNKVPNTEDVKPHIHKKAATKRAKSKPGQKLEQSEDEETSVKSRNKKLKRGKQLGKLGAGSDMKTQSKVSTMDEESPADESEQAEEDSSIQPTLFSQQKTGLKQTTADNTDTGSPSKLETRTIKNSKNRPENNGDDDDDDDEEEVEEEECTIPHNENTEGHKHMKRKSVKKEKKKEDKDVTLKQPKRSKNKKLLTGKQYGKANTESKPTAEPQGTVDGQLKSNKVKIGSTDNVNLRNPSEPKTNKEITDNENSAPSSQQMKRVKPNGKKGVDEEDVLGDDGDDEEEEEEVDEEECVLPHTKDSLPHKHTRRAVKYDKPRNKNEDGDLGRKTALDTNKTEVDTKKGGKKKTDLKNQGSVGKDTVSDYDDEEEEEEEEKECLIQHGNYTAPHTHKKEKSKNKKQSNERNPAVNKTQRIPEGKNDVTEEQIDGSKPQREIAEIPAKDKKESADSRSVKYPVNLPNTPVIGNSEPTNNADDIQDGSRQQPKGKNKSKSEENFKEFPDSDDEEEIEEEECTIPHNGNTELHKHTKKVNTQDKRSNGQIQGKNKKEKSKATKKISPEDSEIPEARSNVNTDFNKPQVDNKNPSKKVKPKSKTSKQVEQLTPEDGMAVPYKTMNADSSNQKQTPETATTKTQTYIESDEETFDEDENSSVPDKPRRPLSNKTNRRSPTKSKDTESNGDKGKPNSIIGQIPRSKKETKNNPNTEITTDGDKDDLNSVKSNNKQNSPSDSEKKLEKKKPNSYNQSTKDDDEEDDEEEEEEVEEEECVLPHNDNTVPHKHTRRRRENDKTDDNQESENNQEEKTSKPNDKQSKLPSQETNYIQQKEIPGKYKTPTGRDDTQPLVKRQKPRDTKKETNEPNDEPNIESPDAILKQSKEPKSVTAFNKSKGKPILNAETDKTSGDDKKDLSNEKLSTTAFSNNRNQLGKLKTKPYNQNIISPTDKKDNAENDSSQLDTHNNKTPDDTTEQPKTQKIKTKIKNTFGNKAKLKTNIDTGEIFENDSDQPEEDLSETSGNKVSPNNGKDTRTLNSPNSKSPKLQGTQVTVSGNSETYAEAEEESPDDDDEEVKEVEEEDCMIPHNDTTRPHKHIGERKANKPDVNKELNGAKEGKISKPSQYKKNKVGDKDINNDKRSKLPSEESDDIPKNKMSEKFETPSGRRQKPRDTKKETSEPDNKNIESPDVTLKQSKAPKTVTPSNTYEGKPEMNAETDKTSDNDEESEEDKIKKQPSSVPFTNDRKQSVEFKTKPYNVNVKSPTNTKGDTEKNSSQLDNDNNKTQDNTVEQPKTKESKTKIKNTFRNKVKPKTNVDTGEIPEDDSHQPGEDLSKTWDNKVLPNNGKDTSTFNSPNSKSPDHKGNRVTASGNSETYAEAEKESQDDDDEEIEEVGEEECMIPHNDTTRPHKHIRKRKANKPDVNKELNGAKEGKISKESQYKKIKVGDKDINNDKRSKLPSEESDDIPNNKISEKNETPSGRRQKPRDAKKETSEPDNKIIESPDVILKQSKAPKTVTPSSTYEGKPEMNAETDKTSDNDEESEGDTMKKHPGSMLFTLKQSDRLKTKPYKLNAKLPIDKKDDTEEDVSKLDDETPDDITEQTKTLKSKTEMKSANRSTPKPKTNEKTEDDLEQSEKDLSQKQDDKDFPGIQKGSSVPSSLNSKSPNQKSTQVTESVKSKAYAEEENDSPDDDEEEIEEEECMIPHNNRTGPHKHTRKKKSNKPDSSQPMKGSNQGKNSSPSQYEQTTAGTDFRKRSKLPSKDTDDLPSETFSTPTEKNKSGSLRNNQKFPKDTRRETGALDDDETKSIGVETKQSETPKSKNKINPRNMKNKLKSDKTPDGDEEEPEDDTFNKQAGNVLLNNHKQPGSLKTKPYNVNTNYSNQQRIGKYQPSVESKNEAHGDGNDSDDDDDDDDDDKELDEEKCTIPHDNFAGPHEHSNKRIKNNKQEDKKKTKNNTNKYLKGNKGTNGAETTGNVLPSEETYGKPYNKRSQTGKSRPLNNIQKAPNTEDNDAKSQDDIPKKSEITKTAKEKNVSQKDRNKQKPQKLTDRDENNPEDVEEESDSGFTKPPNSMIQLDNKKTSDNEKAKPGKSKAMPEKTKSPNENEEEDDDDDEEEVEEEECTIPHVNNTGPHRHTRSRRNRKNNVTEDNKKVESTKQRNTKTPSQYLKDGKDETVIENNKRSKVPSQGTNDTPENGKSDNYETPTSKSNSQPFGMSQKPSRITEKGNRNLDGNVESPDDVSQLSTTKKNKNILNDTKYGRNKEKPQRSRDIDENSDEKLEENELATSSNRMISDDKNSKPNNLNTKSPIQQFTKKKPSKKYQPSPDKEEESPQFVADENYDYNNDEEEEVDEEECTMPHDNNTGPHKHTRKPIKYSKIEKKKKPVTDKRAKAFETPKDNNDVAEIDYGKRSKLPPSDETNDLAIKGMPENNESPSGKDNFRPYEKSQKPYNKNEGRIKVEKESDTKSDDEEESEKDKLKIQTTNNQNISADVKTKPFKINIKFPIKSSPQLTSSGKYNEKDDEENDISQLENNGTESPEDTSKQLKTPKGKNIIGDTQFNRDKTKPQKDRDFDENYENDSSQLAKSPTNKIKNPTKKILPSVSYSKPNSLTNKSPNQQVTANGKLQPYAEKVERPIDEDDNEEDEEEIEEEDCTIPHNNISGPHKHTKRRKKTNKMEDIQNPGTVKERINSNTPQDLQSKNESTGTEYDKRSKGTNELLDKIETEQGKDNSRLLAKPKKPSRNTKKEVIESYDNDNDSTDVTPKQSKIPKDETAYSKNNFEPKVNTESGKNTDMPDEKESEVDRDNNNDNESEGEIYEQPSTLKRQNKVKGYNTAKSNPNIKSNKISGDNSQQQDKCLNKNPSDTVLFSNDNSFPKNQQGASGELQANSELSLRSKYEDDDDDDEEEDVEEEECTLPHYNNMGPHKHTRKIRKNSKPQDNNNTRKPVTNKGEKLSNISQYVKKKKGTMETDKLVPQETGDLPYNDKDFPSQKYETPSEKNNSGTTFDEVQKPSVGARSVISEIGDNDVQSSDDTAGQPDVEKGKNKIKQRPFNKNRVKQKTKTESDKTPSDNKERPEEDTSLNQPVSMTFSSSGNKETIRNNLNKKSPNQQGITSGKFRVRKENRSESSDDIDNDDEDNDEEELVDEEDCVIPHDNLTGPHKHTRRKIKNGKIEGGLQPGNKNAKKPNTNVRTVPGNSELQAANQTLNDYIESSNVAKPVTESGNAAKRKKTQQIETVPGSKSLARQNGQFNSTYKILPYTKNNIGISEKYGKKNVENLNDEEKKEEDDDDDEEEEEEEVEEEDCIIPHTSTTEPHKHTKDIAKLKEYNDRQKLVAEGQNKVFSPQRVSKKRKLSLSSLRGRQNVKSTAQDQSISESDETYTEESPKLNIDSSQKHPKNKTKKIKLKYDKSNGATLENEESSSGHSPSNTKEETQIPKAEEIVKTGDANNQIEASALPTSSRRSLVYPEFHGENNNNCYGSTPSSGSTPLESYKTRQGYNDNQGNMCDLDPRKVSVDIDNVIVEDPKAEDDSDTSDEDTDENSKPESPDSSCKTPQDGETESQSKWPSTGGNGMGGSSPGKAGAGANSAVNANANWMPGSPSGWQSMPFFNMAPFMYASGFPQSSNCKPQPSSTYAKMQPFMYHKPPTSKKQKYGQPKNKFKTNPKTYMTQSAKSWSGPGSSGGVKCQVQTSSSGPGSFKTATYKYPFTKKW